MLRLFSATLVLSSFLLTNQIFAQETSYLFIDLETAVNQPSHESFAPGGYRGDDLSDLPTGVQELSGVKFDIADSVVQMMGKHLVNHPHRAARKVKGLYVGTTVERLHLLHAARWGAFGERGDKWNHWVPDGVPIAYYEVIYADHSSVAIPVVYGEDVRDWWSVWDDNKPTTRSEVAWSGTNPHLLSRPEARGNETPLRLYHTNWANPHPEKQVTEVNIVSLNQIPALFTVAMTVETTDSKEEFEKRRLEEQIKRLKKEIRELKQNQPQGGGFGGGGGGSFF